MDLKKISKIIFAILVSIWAIIYFGGNYALSSKPVKLLLMDNIPKDIKEYGEIDFDTGITYMMNPYIYNLNYVGKSGIKIEIEEAIVKSIGIFESEINVRGFKMTGITSGDDSRDIDFKTGCFFDHCSVDIRLISEKAISVGVNISIDSEEQYKEKVEWLWNSINTGLDDEFYKSLDSISLTELVKVLEGKKIHHQTNIYDIINDLVIRNNMSMGVEIYNASTDELIKILDGKKDLTNTFLETGVLDGDDKIQLKITADPDNSKIELHLGVSEFTGDIIVSADYLNKLSFLKEMIGEHSTNASTEISIEGTLRAPDKFDEQTLREKRNEVLKSAYGSSKPNKIIEEKLDLIIRRLTDSLQDTETKVTILIENNLRVVSGNIEISGDESMDMVIGASIGANKSLTEIRKAVINGDNDNPLEIEVFLMDILIEIKNNGLYGHYEDLISLLYDIDSSITGIITPSFSEIMSSDLNISYLYKMTESMLGQRPFNTLLKKMKIQGYDDFKEKAVSFIESPNFIKVEGVELNLMLPSGIAEIMFDEEKMNNLVENINVEFN